MKTLVIITIFLSFYTSNSFSFDKKIQIDIENNHLDYLHISYFIEKIKEHKKESIIELSHFQSLLKNHQRRYKISVIPYNIILASVGGADLFHNSRKALMIIKNYFNNSFGAEEKLLFAINNILNNQTLIQLTKIKFPREIIKHEVKIVKYEIETVATNFTKAHVILNQITLNAMLAHPDRWYLFGLDQIDKDTWMIEMAKAHIEISKLKVQYFSQMEESFINMLYLYQ